MTRNIASVLSAGTATLQASGVPESRRDAVLLLCAALNRTNTYIIAHPDHELTDDEKERLDQFLERRKTREPMQYILGKQEFFALEFEVSPDVLIPRPETEILVEAAIEMLSRRPEPLFCEIGIGSGCISVSILHEVDQARAVAVDISPAALAIARRNAARHDVGKRLCLLEGSMFGPVDGHFDLIVSNPPYVPSGELPTLQPEVRDFEPANALDGGHDGLDLIRKIIDRAPGRLKGDGLLLIEIGSGQAEAVRELFSASDWGEPEFLQDLQGVPRIVKAGVKFPVNTR